MLEVKSIHENVSLLRKVSKLSILLVQRNLVLLLNPINIQTQLTVIVLDRYG